MRRLISRNIQYSDYEALDKALGFLFGILRAVLIAALVYLFLLWIAPAEKHPSWIKNARSLPLMRITALFIKDALPDDLKDDDKKEQTPEKKEQKKK